MDGYSVRLTVLFPILIIGTILSSLVLTGLIYSVVGAGRGIIFGLTFAASAWLLHGAAGWLLNGERTEHGRRWHNKYYIGGLPVQFAGVPYTVIGWAVVCYSIGNRTSAWVGWPVFLLAPVAALLAVRMIRRRRSPAGVHQTSPG